jgi:hypothetical protein
MDWEVSAWPYEEVGRAGLAHCFFLAEADLQHEIFLPAIWQWVNL